LGLADQARAEREGQRGSKEPAFSLRPAAQEAVSEYQAMTLEGRTIYVSPRTLLSDGELTGVEAVATHSGADVTLTLTPTGVERLGSGTPGQQVAIFAAGTLVSVGTLSVDAATGTATISGLPSGAAQRLVQMVAREPVAPAGPRFSVRPSATQLRPGGTVDVDVYLSGTQGLRAYQVTLGVSGGDSGQLAVEDNWIDAARPGYVFGALEKLDAVDRSGDRMAGLLIYGNVDAVEPAYLGTYTLRASPDAAGTFRVFARADNEASILIDAQDLTISFGSAPAAITVGIAPRPPQPLPLP
jgi:hypothetical protein